MRPGSQTFFIETWGCQMNDLDTQRLAGQLKLRGLRRVEDPDTADLILLNTCSIREKAERKVYNRLHQLRPAKQRGATIGVSGCVAQQEGQALIDHMPWVDFVIGPANVGLIDSVLTGERRLAVDFPDERRYDYLSVDRPSAVRAQVTVIEGCNKNCTFCIVPTTRGREVSRPMRDILTEVRYEVSQGRPEIELLGQTVNAYQCPEGEGDFSELLQQVATTPGVQRLRFVTSHPALVTNRLIEVIRDNRNICRYLHLPVQSGSTRVLRRMKRLYSRERYLEIIDGIRTAVPEMNFSTDVIVGFPGETEEDFEQTLTLLNELKFGNVFAFKYSQRPGTPALRLGPPVDDAVASERLSRLFALQEQIERSWLESFVGRTLPVLYEGPSRHDPEVCSGKTDDNRTVNFRTRSALAVGSIIPVVIQQAQHHTLRGEVDA